MKSITTIILTILVSVGVVFGWSGGSGTSGDPWQVDSCTDINDTGRDGIHNLNHNYVLIKDLYCASVPGVSGIRGRFFTGGHFVGKFDGGGYSLHGLNISNIIAGLFGENVVADIFDLTVRDSILTTGATGKSMGVSNITNCHSINNTIGRFNANAGGFASSGGYYTNCSSRDNYIESLVVGGIVAYLEWGSSVKNSFSIGNVIIGTNGAAGGIAGYIRTFGPTNSIENSYAVNNLINSSSDIYYGGLVGINQENVIDSYAACNNITYNGVKSGGISALNQGSVTDSYSDETNLRLDNNASIDSFGTDTGTLSCAADSDCGGPGFDITGYTLAALGGWDSDVWTMSEHAQGFPTLKNVDGDQSFTCDVEPYTEPGAYAIPEFSTVGLIFIVAIFALIMVVRNNRKN